MKKVFHADREAYRECVAIVKLLLNLNEKYKRLKELAIDDQPSFYREVILFARKLLDARQRIKEFLSRYHKCVRWGVDYKTGEFELEYIGEYRHMRTQPLKINPYLLRELDIPSNIPNVDEVLHETISSIASEEIELLRPKEAAQLLNVSYKTLWRWWREGKIRAIQIGPSKRLRYYKNDLEKFISKSTT